MLKQLCLASLAAFIVPPMCIFTHELGHYAVALSYGWEAKLMPAMVRFQAPGLTDFQRILFGAGGPMVDVLQFTTGFLILFICRNDPAKSSRLFYWMGVALASVVGKWFMAPIFAIAMPTINDEAQISSLLGWPRMLLPIAVMLLSIPMLFVLVKQHLRDGSWFPLCCIPVVGLLGAAAWIMFIGPLLLNAS